MRVELTVDPAARGVDAEVTVSIEGGEDGPVVQTMEVSGDQDQPAEVSISTRSSKSKLSVKVTSAEAL